MQLTIKQAAARRGCHRTLINRWIKQGRIAARKIGVQWIVDSTSLDMIKDRRHGKANHAYGKIRQGIRKKRIKKTCNRYQV